MRLARTITLALTITAIVAGCGWLSPRGGGGAGGAGRDPLLMSHLTHGKGDPMFAGADSDLLLEDDDGAFQAASISRKYPKPTATAQTVSYNGPAVGEGYVWLRGKLERRGGSRPGWYLRYATASSKDAHGGALLLEDDPRIGLLRVGDRVFVEGKLIQDSISGVRYKLDTIRLLDQ